MGSNSIKLNVFDTQRGAPKSICHKSWVTQLGRDIQSNGELHPESLDKTDQALRAMAAILSESYPDIPTTAVATAAARQSSNNQLLVAMVAQHLNIKLDIIDAQREAYLSALGASAASQVLAPQNEKIFVDVGGASTEVATFHPSFNFHSFHTGALRSHQELKLEDIPNSDEQWNHAKQNISSLFPANNFPQAQPKLVVAVGGTLYLAAKLTGGREVDDKGLLSSAPALSQLADQYRKLNLEQRVAQLEMPQTRAKILPAGILCLLEILHHYDTQEVFITHWGLRHGLILEDKLHP